MRPLGILTILALLLAPLYWLQGIAQTSNIFALFSQYLGLVALIAMALGQVIATRWPGVELLFGPMDQAYRLHKWLGIAAVSAVLLHDTFDAEIRGLGRETLLTDFAVTLGQISLYGLLALVVITIATFIPYHLWKTTHRFIGVFFVMGAVHYLFVLKPFANGDPLGLYMSAVCALGPLAWLWTSMPRALRPARGYRITGLHDEGDALAIDMAPTARPLRHRAGQFAFFGFDGAGMPEPHPFTISSAPSQDGALRISVAPLGDYTIRLRNAVAEGQTLRVQGPFGRFGRARGPQVWIAAGIGVTPFLALAGALPEDSAPVTMIYAVRDRATAPHMAELESRAASHDKITLVVWESKSQGRLDADKIAGIVGESLAKSTVSFCGPSDMRRSLSAGLAKHGVSARRFHFEAFEIRTGLGLRKLAAAAETWWQRRAA